MKLLTKTDALDHVKRLLNSSGFRNTNPKIECDLLLAEIESNPNISQELLLVESESFRLTHSCDVCDLECESVVLFYTNCGDCSQLLICKDCLQKAINLFNP